MSKDAKPRKAKSEKVYTRAQAERALSAGADPEPFSKHANYHVRAKAWKKMGSPLPENAEERVKFLATLHLKEKLTTLEQMTALEENADVGAGS